MKILLASCRECEGALYYTLSLRNSKSKDVQVIPWSILDSCYVPVTNHPLMKLDPGRTVYVGALHGTLSAKGLFHIMDELFEGVIYSGELYMSIMDLKGYGHSEQ